MLTLRGEAAYHDASWSRLSCLQIPLCWWMRIRGREQKVQTPQARRLRRFIDGLLVVHGSFTMTICGWWGDKVGIRPWLTASEGPRGSLPFDPASSFPASPSELIRSATIFSCPSCVQEGLLDDEDEKPAEVVLVDTARCRLPLLKLCSLARMEITAYMSMRVCMPRHLRALSWSPLETSETVHGCCSAKHTLSVPAREIGRSVSS